MSAPSFVSGDSWGNVAGTSPNAFTISSNSNRLLIVAFASEGYNYAGTFPSAVSYNSVTMTKYGETSWPAHAFWYLWEADLPSGGSYDIAWTGGGAWMALKVAEFKDVGQGFWAATGSSSGTGSYEQGGSIAVKQNQLAFDVITADGDYSCIPQGNQTEIDIEELTCSLGDDARLRANLAMSYEGYTDGTAEMQWNFGNSIDWQQTMITLGAAGGGNRMILIWNEIQEFYRELKSGRLTRDELHSRYGELLMI